VAVRAHGLGGATPSATVSYPSAALSMIPHMQPSRLGFGYASQVLFASRSLLQRCSPVASTQTRGFSTAMIAEATGMLGSQPRCGAVCRPVRAGLCHSLGSTRFMTRNLRGRMFYKRRPKMVPRWKFNWRSKLLEGAPHKKGVCTKVSVVAPKKPNAGLRKVAMVRLSNGRVVKVYIPGIGHNLQVHSVVMVRGGRKRDVIGCNLTAMRGHYDLLPVKNRKSSRSKYGVSRPQVVPKRKRFKTLTTAVDRRLHFYRKGEQVGPDDTIPKRITHVVRNNPPISYRHSLKKTKK